MNHCLDPIKIAQSGKTLRISAVSLRTGELVFIDERGMARSRSKEYEVDLRKAVLASASIPVVFPAQSLLPGYELDLMVDGGVGEVAPLGLARELGADATFVILASSPFIGSSWGMRRVAMDVAGRTMDILVNEVTRNDVTSSMGSDDWINMPFRFGNSTTVIYPTVPVHDGMDVDPVSIRINADYGWMVASDVLRNLPRAQTATLLESAHAIPRAFLTGNKIIMEIRRSRGDFVKAEYERKLSSAAARAKELLIAAVRKRQEVGGEIPERLRPLLQGAAPSAPVLAGVPLPSVVGRTAYTATQELRELGLEIERVRVTGVAGSFGPETVIAQRPNPGQRLTAGCQVTLTVARDRGPSQKPAPRPGPNRQTP